ncbi:MAG: cell division protein FtsZ [Candidatus Buchananbacteria bacterium]|jgi:cell division protein FtsZ
MPEIKPDIETIAKIKVVGVGGSGGSAVNRMIATKIRGVDFIAVNTDVQALLHSTAKTKFHIGQKITRGLGAGMNPAVGLASAQENAAEIKDILKGSDMVFITCGLGGGTGTGASPVIAQIAKEAGALVVAVVTKPFAFEGKQRLKIADEGLEFLRPNVDAIITIPNEKIWQIIDQKTSFMDAFKEVDDILRQGIQGISEIITVPAIINVDFADVKAIMKDAGSALMSIGEASGENRAVTAAKMAVASPLLDLSIDGAKGVLFVISGSSDLTMNEVNEIASIITAGADENAKIIFGANIDETLKDKIRVTLVATGFGESLKKPMRPSDRGAWGDKINNIFVDKTPDKEDSGPRFGTKAVGGDSEPTIIRSRSTSDEHKKSFFGFGNRGGSEEDFDVPPIIRQGGSFKPIEVVSRDEESVMQDDFDVPPVRMRQDEPLMSDEDDEDLELPSFIRKKMK